MKKTILIIMTLMAAMSAGAQNLTVLHMNDTHSHIDHLTRFGIGIICFFKLSADLKCLLQCHAYGKWNHLRKLVAL